MSGRYSAEAKAKERVTRAALGPRLPRPEWVPHAITAAPRTPRATGVPRGQGKRIAHDQ